MSAASVPAGGRRQPNRLRGLAERISQYRPREKVSREKQAFSQEPMHGHQREKSRHLSGISNAACIPFTRASALDGYVLLSKMGDKPADVGGLTKSPDYGKIEDTFWWGTEVANRGRL